MLEEIIPQDGPDQILPADNLTSCDINTPVKLRPCLARESDTPPISVPTLLRRVAERYPNNVALSVKRHGYWQKTTFSQYYQLVRKAAKSFIKLGLQPGQSVALLGFNSPEYFIGNMAAIMAGGVSTGIYVMWSSDTFCQCINQFDVTMLLVENNWFRHKFAASFRQCPRLNTIIQYAEPPNSDTDTVLTWDSFLSLADEVDDSVLDQRLRGIAVNKCATVMFTPGTLSSPKGAMLSHDSVTWLAQWGVSVLSMTPPTHGPGGGGVGETLVSYMPLAHAAGAAVDLYIALAAGATVYFAQPDAYEGTLLATLTEVPPTVFVSTSLMYQLTFLALNTVLGMAGGLPATLVNMCRTDVDAHAKQGGNKSRGMGSWLSNKLLAKLRSKMGMQNVHHAFSTGGPIAVDTLNYMHSIQVPVHEMYGLTETLGPAVFNTSSQFRRGSIGLCPAECQLNIVHQQQDGIGELVYRGRNMLMGYVNDEAATRRAIDEQGWFHTQDFGRKDADGFFYVTGRLSEIIRMEDGTRVFPVSIEEKILAELKIFQNVLLYGEKRQYLTALFAFKVHVEPGTVAATDKLLPECVQWMNKQGVHENTVSACLTRLNQFSPAIEAVLERVNSQAATASHMVRRWKVLPVTPCMHSAQITPTMVPRRQKIFQVNQDLIEQMYAQ